MKIGILGAGNIGSTLANRLAAAGHQVKVANSRGPETISPHALSTGATAVSADEVAAGVDVLITSVPYARIPDIAPLVADAPQDALVIDTSNYYPHRDGNIAAIDDGQVESLWVIERFGRPVVKAWNAINTLSFDSKARPKGHPDRVAIPVAGNDKAARALAMSLVEETGFDAFDAGTLEHSWRQQPGTPVYCTDLSKDQIGAGLEAADPKRRIVRRDLMIKAHLAFKDEGTPVRPADYLVQFHRVFNT